MATGRSAVVAAFFLVAHAAAGQGPAGAVAVFPLQDLSFGLVPPGWAAQVPPTDAGRSAIFELRSQGAVLLVFDLPTAMVGPRGASVPLEFGVGDGWIRWPTGQELFFDPRAPLSVPLGPTGRAYVHLGGRVRPEPRQPPGQYQGSIVLRLLHPGA